jgi:hypothetical protein
MHNPPRLFAWIPGGWKQEGASLVTRVGNTVYQIVRKSDDNVYETYFATYRGSMKKESGSLGLSRTVNDAMTKAERHSLTGNPPVAPGKSPAAHFLRAEMLGGKTPAQALRAVGRRFAGRLPRAALKGAFDAIRHELVGGLEGHPAGMSDWAGMAAMRMGSYKKFSRNPHRRPDGKSAVKIYGHTEKIFMQKTGGPYKGQRFVHDFKPGVQQVGLPRNTAVRTPDGRTFRLTTRSVVLTGKKDIWRNFPA